jgi:tetratricopeptide (TPR) repeat protein
MAYENPYYALAPVATSAPVYDYSQPIDTTSAAPDASVVDPAMSTFDQARAAFKAGDFDQALTLSQSALKSVSNDPAIHEFSAIALFALGRYDESAGALYGVLSVGPGWDWTTLISLYSDVDVYTNQLRALEKYADGNPQSASARFILAYLYLTAGQNDSAIVELQQVVALQPNDRLSSQLLEALQKKPTGDAPADPSTPAAAPAPAAPAVDPAKTGTLTGTWTASPAQGTTITLTLAADGAFTWKVSVNGDEHTISGTSNSAADILTLAQTNGGPPLVGNVRWQSPDRFVFQALGGGAGDPGLTFSKS